MNSILVTAGYTLSMAKKKPEESPEPDMTYEQAIEQLESIIDAIESGEVGLEASLAQTEQGMKLITHCRGILDRAEKRIAELSVDEQGALKPKD